MKSRVLLVGFMILGTAWARPAAFWATRDIAGDPMLFVQGADGGPARASLLLVPEGPPVLRNAEGTITYAPGRDYLWKPGERAIALAKGSRIPFQTTAALHPAHGAPNSIGACRGGKSDLLFGSGSDPVGHHLLHRMQTLADYRARSAWNGPVPPPANPGKLPHLRARLAARAPVKLVVLGDSISTGLNSSLDVPPHQPGYPDLLARGLAEDYRVRVTLENLSVGGTSTPWGLQQVDRVIASKPDLFVCAFGMNDASHGTTPPDFAVLIARLAGRVVAACPGCDVILVSPMTANPEWTHSAPDLYPQYAEVLGRLGEAGPAIAVADVTAVWNGVLERKAYLDLSGNGINHPNDFGHRLYADVILALLGGARPGS